MSNLKTAAPVVRYAEITPAMATRFLQRSKRKNVPISERKIAQYAKAMLAGEWDEYNSQAISIDTNEDIVNGHQRLLACERAGVPFRTMLITGVPPESFKTEDTGRSRDAGHFFAIKGEKYYTEIASGARALYVWERGMWRFAATTSGGGNIFISNDELEDELERRPQLRAAAEFASKHKNALRGRFKTGMIVALHVLTQGHRRHGAFWKELVERLTDDPRSAPYRLNKRIDEHKSRGANLSALSSLALLTKAWNFFSQDDTRELMWDKDKEPMPVPLTQLVPALLPPPPPVDNAPKLNGKPPARVKVKPSGTKVKRKKGPRVLRGGIGHAAA